MNRRGWFGRLLGGCLALCGIPFVKAAKQADRCRASEATWDAAQAKIRQLRWAYLMEEDGLSDIVIDLNRCTGVMRGVIKSAKYSEWHEGPGKGPVHMQIELFGWDGKTFFLSGYTILFSDYKLEYTPEQVRYHYCAMGRTLNGAWEFLGVGALAVNKNGHAVGCKSHRARGNATRQKRGWDAVITRVPGRMRYWDRHLPREMCSAQVKALGCSLLCARTIVFFNQSEYPQGEMLIGRVCHVQGETIDRIQI